MTDFRVSPPLVLVFAASDPSCGAGIQADILTLSSLGCHPLAVITALTVQDTVGVESVHPVDSEVVERQARALLEDMPVAAFKVGVLGSVENVLVVAEIVSDYPDIPLVLDPVLASGRGDEFANEDLRAALRELLLPQTTVLTPNSVEARRLAGDEDDELDEEACSTHVSEDLAGLPSEVNTMSLGEAAGRLIGYGAEYVLLTGAHEQTTQVTNSLYSQEGLLRQDNWERLPGSYHGSGCTLASALAACLAGGADVESAVQEAQEYTWQTLAHAFRPGMGQFIPDRLFWARESDASDGDVPEAKGTDHA